MENNLNSNRFYVYILLDPRKGVLTPFYVGKGQRDRYAKHFRNSARKFSRNLLKERVIDKITNANMTAEVCFYASDLTEEDAFVVECQLIAHYGRRNKNTGILTNLTDGGEGGSGVVISDETREKMRQRMTGAGSPTYGVGHTDEARAKMSKTRKERAAKGLVTRHSEAHKQRMREDNRGGAATRKQVLKLTADGEQIATYPSMKALADELGVSKNNCASAVVKDGSIPRDGFFYRYTNSADITPDGIKNAADLIKRREMHERGALSGKAVQKLTPDGALIATYESIRAAVAANPNTKYAALWAAVKYKRAYGEAQWRYAG